MTPTRRRDEAPGVYRWCKGGGRRRSGDSARVRWALFTLIPAGFVGYLPSHLVRAPAAETAMWVALGVAAYAALAIWVYQRGLRTYSSGSRFATFG